MGIPVSREQLTSFVGKELGVSDWFTIDQDRIDRFADATLDHQFIHVDPERAKVESPFGGTIAHGLLTLSLVPHLIEPLRLEPVETKLTLNYGFDRVRFIQPVPAGSRIRVRLKLLDITERNTKQMLFKFEATVEIEKKAKPALVAEGLGLYQF
jgi:acyl dehydratase